MADKPTSTPPSSPSQPDRLETLVREAEAEQNAPDFKESFRQKLEQMKLTREELEDLSRRFESSKVENIKKEAREVILEQMKAERQGLSQTIDPRTWSRETQVNAALITGGVVVGGALLAWVSKKMANATEKARATGRKIRNGILWMVGAAAVIGGTYLGYKAWQNWGEIKKQMAHLKNLNEKLATATGNTKKEVLAQIKGAEARIAAMQKTAPESPETPVEAPRPAEGGMKEKAKEAAETVTQNMLGNGLTLLHSDLAEKAGFNVKTRSHDADIIEGVLNLEPVRKLRIPDMVRIASNNTFEQARPAIIELLKKEGIKKPLQESELRAVYFLALVAQAQQKNIRTPEGTNTEDLRVETLLDQTGNIARLLARTKEKMQGVELTNPADVSRRLSAIFGSNLREDIGSSASLQKEMEKIGLKKEDIAGFTLFCTQNGKTLLTSVASLSTQPDEQKYAKALSTLRDTIMENDGLKTDIREYIQLFTHKREDFALPLNDRLAQLNINDAVQLYLYTQQARDADGKLPTNLDASSPLTALPMQMKVLSMIGSVDTFEQDKLKAFLLLEAGDTKTGIPTLPSALRETMPLVRDIIVNAAKDSAMDWMAKLKAYGSEVDTKSPWVKYVTGAVLAQRFNRRFHIWRANVSAKKLVSEMMGKAYARHMYPNVFQRVGNMVSAHGIAQNAQGMRARANVFKKLTPTNQAKPVFSTPANTPVSGKPATTFKGAAPASKAPKSVAPAVKTVQTLGKGAENIRNVTDLARELKIARDAKDYEKLLELGKHSLVNDAAKAGSTEAKALSRVGRLLSKGTRVLPYAGMLLEAALFDMNETDIKEAIRTKNVGVQKTLESKRATLLSHGAGGLAMFAMSGPQVLAAAPTLVATSFYTQAIYDAVIDWEKSSTDWLKKTPDELKAELKKRPMGYKTAAHELGVDNSVGRTTWRWLTMNKDEFSADVDSRDKAMESINEKVRTEILTAYFLKTMPAQPEPGETQKQFVERQALLMRDRLMYIHSTTNGSFDTSNWGAAMYESPHLFAQISAFRRALPANNRKTFTYSVAGKERTLNFAALDYAHGKKAPPGAELDLLKTMKQFEDEVVPFLKMLRELKEEEEWAQRKIARSKEWDTAKPKREAQMAENESLRASAAERAKLPGSMTYVPGRAVANDKKKIFKRETGEFRGTTEGHEVSIPFPRHSMDDETFRFSAVTDGKKHSYGITMNSLRENNVLTDTDKRIARYALTTPYDDTNVDKSDIETIRKHELARMLNITTYEKPIGSKNVAENREHLFNELWPVYQKTKDKKVFLNTLLDLLIETKTITRSTSSYIAAEIARKCN